MAQPKVVANRYELLERIGEGGAGSVYRARDRKFAVMVALKIMRASGERYAELRDRAWQEAQISHVLGQEKGLVRTIDWGEVEDDAGRSVYLALDLIEGATPLDLSLGSLDLRLATISEAAELVSHCHDHNVVHRDIKPVNFLISREGQLFLSDFGIAKKVGSLSDSSEELGLYLTDTGSAMGTPVFMSLEQLEDASSVDTRADVFSLGVMLYFALTGQYPYGLGGLPVVYGRQCAVRRGERPPPRPTRIAPEVPKELDRLCADAISVDRGRRPDSNTFLAALGYTDATTRQNAREERIGLLEEVSRLLQSDEQATLRIDRNKTVRRAALEPWTSLELTRVRSHLNIEADGFLTARRLLERARLWGARKLSLLTRDVPVLLVHHERALNGVTRLDGRAALLLPSPERAENVDVLLGRSRANDLRIPFPSISKHHLRLSRTGESWSVTELGSRNGTQLNGVRLEPEVISPLRDGDLLNLSQHVTLRFSLQGSLSQYVEIAGDPA